LKELRGEEYTFLPFAKVKGERAKPSKKKELLKREIHMGSPILYQREKKKEKRKRGRG